MMLFLAGDASTMTTAGNQAPESVPEPSQKRSPWANPPQDVLALMDKPRHKLTPAERCRRWEYE